jgi:hypothetical protein
VRQSVSSPGRRGPIAEVYESERGRPAALDPSDTHPEQAPAETTTMSRPLPAWATVTTLAALAAGCTHDLRPKSDPILGGDPPKSAPASRLRTPYPPVPLSAPPPAALAAGLDRAPDDGDDFRSPTPRPLASGVTLAAPATGGGWSPVAGPRGGTVEEWQDDLLRRGLRDQRLEPTADGLYRFTASRPRPGSPGVNRRYQAVATTPLAAVQAVADQLARDGG